MDRLSAQDRELSAFAPFRRLAAPAACCGWQPGDGEQLGRDGPDGADLAPARARLLDLCPPAQLPAVPATLSLQSQTATGPSGEHHPSSIPCPSRVADFSLFSLLLFKCLSSRLWSRPYSLEACQADSLYNGGATLAVALVPVTLVLFAQERGSRHPLCT